MKRALGSESAGISRAGRTYFIHGEPIPAPALAPGLHVVATPIGNLGDVTLRALAILAGADRILAEDTRVSRTLLDRYRIQTPLSSYHEHNAAEARPRALESIAEGRALALISDAGTPLISDPGYKLVSEAVAAGSPGYGCAGPVRCVGRPMRRRSADRSLLFRRFLPPKSAARRERINTLASVPATLVFYEAPSRLAETLADLATELGARPAAVARELTKLHEDIRRGALDALAAEYAVNDAPRGEIVIVVGPPEARPAISEDALDNDLVVALRTLSVKDAAAAVAAKHGLPRRQLYARALAPCGSRAVSARNIRRSNEAKTRGISLRPQGRIARGFAAAAKRLLHSCAAIRSRRRRNRYHRATGRFDRFRRGEGRADLDMAADSISAAKRRRIARGARVWLAAQPVGRRTHTAWRRRLRRPATPSPPRSVRV